VQEVDLSASHQPPLACVACAQPVGVLTVLTLDELTRGRHLATCEADLPDLCCRARGAGGGYIPPESEPKVVAEDKDTDYVCCELFNATNPPPKVTRLTTYDILKLLSRRLWTSAATCCAPPPAVPGSRARGLTWVLRGQDWRQRYPGGVPNRTPPKPR